MINFDGYASENKTEHNINWPYRVLIIGGSGSGKTNVLLNLVETQPGIDKIYLYPEDTYEAKYQYLIKIRENVGIGNFNDAKAYIEYSNDMHDIYKNIGDYNPDGDNKNLMVFDDMIADMINNIKLKSIVTGLFIRGRKLNISLVFITQSYFKVPKDVRLNTTHYFIAKIPNKRELQQIARNHSSDIRTEDFINIYRFTIEQARFTDSPLPKAFEKQIKTIEDRGQKQVDALNTLKFNYQLTIEDVIPKKTLGNGEAKKEFDKIKGIDKNVDRKKLVYETNEYTSTFKRFVETFMRVKLLYKKLTNIKLIYHSKS